MEYTIDDTRQQCTVVYLQGPVDASNASEFKDILKDMLNEGALRLVIDKAEVSFIDSSGLSAFVTAFRSIRERNGKLALANIGQQVQVALELTRLNQLFPIYEDIESAVNSIG